jgi:hypothetical protein
MTLFKVKIEETAIYTIQVDAPNEDTAGHLAEEAFLGSITCDYPTEVTVRDVVEIKRMRKRKL